MSGSAAVRYVDPRAASMSDVAFFNRLRSTSAAVEMSYCAGALQSNMELPMLHDHSRNNSFDRVMAGKYTHIRLMEMGKNKLRDGSSADGNDHVSLACARA